MVVVIALFQSSSSPKAGCYIDPRDNTSPYPRFNPHPARRPDATISHPLKDAIFAVSILIQPEGRMLRGLHDFNLLFYWFQSSSSPKAGCYAMPSIMPRKESLFQSSSSPKAGCYTFVVKAASSAQCFNPHPARRPDATKGDGATPLNYTVSILIQPEGRMLRQFLAVPVPRNKFQSSSSPKAGCYYHSSVVLRGRCGFNPHPARRPDATIEFR